MGKILIVVSAVILVLLLVIAALVWNNSSKGTTIETLTKDIKTLESDIEGLEANESLLLTRLKARDISLQAVKERQQELETELKGKERVVREYVPVEVTNESNCLDLRPPADLIDRLHSDSGSSEDGVRGSSTL